jgi:cytochrome c-type biogenesis protein CcmH/NrfG
MSKTASDRPAECDGTLSGESAVTAVLGRDAIASAHERLNLMSQRRINVKWVIGLGVALLLVIVLSLGSTYPFQIVVGLPVVLIVFVFLLLRLSLIAGVEYIWLWSICSAIYLSGAAD